MKYSLTENTKIIGNGITLFQIKAEKDIERIRVNKGELGGWIEKESNLSQEGDCWVRENAQIFGNACVYGNACVFGNARVYGNAWVFGNACVYENVHIFEYAQVYGYAQIFGNSYVYGHAQIHGSIKVYGDVCIFKTIQAEKEPVKIIDSRDEIDLLIDCIFN